MFGFLKNIIRTIIIILAIIGFISIGGLTFLREHINLPFFGKSESKIAKAEKIADFSNLNDEFELISSGTVPFTGDYAYIKHIASDQKALFFVSKKQETLTQEDFSSPGTVSAKITDFVNNFHILGFKFENFKITGNGSIYALNQNIPFVKFDSDIVNLPIRGTQGIIGAAKIKNGKNATIICFNAHGKYSQIITSVFLSEVKIDK